MPVVQHTAATLMLFLNSGADHDDSDSITANTDAAFVALWNLGASSNGMLKASAAAALLKTSGLGDAALRKVWSRAKGTQKDNRMNKTEFLLACKYTAEAGGIIDHKATRLHGETAAAESSNV